jgi:hypothetical protein
VWSWLNRFRVWAANRVSFLFPESWLEPEQRPPKKRRFRRRP